MTSRKRNEWLDDAASDEEEDQGYNSEEQEESRGARSIKRRRVDQDSDDESQPDYDDDEDSLNKAKASAPTPAAALKGRFELNDDDADDFAPEQDEEDEEKEAEEIAQTKQKVQPLTQKQLLKSQKAAKRTGVIYISRIPPFMKPATLKHYLEPYGEIGRVFLTPEDPVAQKQRVRNGGNKKRTFTDGWVEFINKKNAKVVAESLNGNIIGGKKGSYYHDDLWNIKYLTGFKWSHLTEQIANENAERAARLRAEVAKTRRENRSFVEDVERSKMLEGMRAKKAAQVEKGGDVDGAKGGAGVRELTRLFKQNEVKGKKGKELPKAEQTADVQKVLSKIF